jgi:hypothetical protein
MSFVYTEVYDLYYPFVHAITTTSRNFFQAVLKFPVLKQCQDNWLLHDFVMIRLKWWKQLDRMKAGSTTETASATKRQGASRGNK